MILKQPLPKCSYFDTDKKSKKQTANLIAKHRIYIRRSKSFI